MGVSFSFGLIYPMSAQTIPDEVKKAFAPFAVKNQFRHRFEDLELKSIDGKKTLLINVWYESSAVTKTGKPDTQVFCRIAHMAIFGRHLDRSRSKELPLALAFQKIADLDQVRINFFAQILTNKPLPPSWAQKPVATASQASDPNAKLRVIWGREERLINYLSYAIQRGEWKTMSSLFKQSAQTNHENFENEFCPSVLKIAPNLRANFTEINKVLSESRSGGQGQ
jgi:hypothetical protein